MVTYCPQHNVLQQQLSVEEHLRIYAFLQGGSTDTMEEQVRHSHREKNTITLWLATVLSYRRAVCSSRYVLHTLWAVPPRQVWAGFVKMVRSRTGSWTALCRRWGVCCLRKVLWQTEVLWALTEGSKSSHQTNVVFCLQLWFLIFVSVVSKCLSLSRQLFGPCLGLLQSLLFSCDMWCYYLFLRLLFVLNDK